jgi:hypothetical protein
MVVDLIILITLDSHKMLKDTDANTRSMYAESRFLTISQIFLLVVFQEIVKKKKKDQVIIFNGITTVSL